MEPEKLIGYVPDPKYQKENTEQGRVALIVVPTLVVSNHIAVKLVP